MDTEKETLAGYLRDRRSDLLSKLEGLGEYDLRRPMTATGTNLLGLVKHTASVELGYFTDTFGRPSGRELPWFAEGAEPDADFWSPPEESSADVVELHHFSAGQAEATIAALELDSPGAVPWWPEGHRAVTLHRILVHMCVETARHAGHADIVRELIDQAAGQRPGDRMVSHRDAAGWAAHRARLEQSARTFLPGLSGE